MKLVVAAAAIAALLIPTGRAWAWGEEGHLYAGAVAERMLTKNALEHVNDILGFKDGKGISLREAAAWADCARDVKKTAAGFEFVVNKKYPLSATCALFDKERLKSYIERNWSNCVYLPGQACASAFHFVNIPLERGAYRPDYTGASDHDVVMAINAAIAKLEGKSDTGFFKFRDDEEALMLLAHFVGDVHQPLHVGSIYLTKDGQDVDPAGPQGSQAMLTAGGNILKWPKDRQDPKTPGIDYTNMHSDWDSFPRGLSAVPSLDVMKAARALPKMSGPLDAWSTAWAGESITAARSAFAGVSFSAYNDDANGWLVTFADRDQYVLDKEDTQRKRLIAAGAHLAQILNKIWP